MSKRSGKQKPRLKRGMALFLLIVGSGFFVTFISLITYSQLEDSGSPVVMKLLASKEYLFAKLDELNQGGDGTLIVADLTTVKNEAEDVLGESEDQTESSLEDKVFETEIQFEQNDIFIRAIQFEMVGEILLVRFEINNDSGSTLYFPFHGTYASFRDNGGLMYRDSNKEGGVGSDQITSVIEPGESIIGKISYSPLLYRDKPFTIYINSMKFRDRDADWESFEFYFDPEESSAE